MSWVADLVKGGAEGILSGVNNIVDEFHLSGEEKQQFQVAFSSVVMQAMDKVIGAINTNLRAKERVLVAELQQGDNYTKRARPTVVYVGLAFIFLVHVLIPMAVYFAVMFGLELPENLPELKLPTEFWLAWGGIVSTWAIGRSVEKAKIGGIAGRLASVITGSKKSSLLD